MTKTNKQTNQQTNFQQKNLATSILQWDESYINPYIVVLLPFSPNKDINTHKYSWQQWFDQCSQWKHKTMCDGKRSSSFSKSLRTAVKRFVSSSFSTSPAFSSEKELILFIHHMTFHKNSKNASPLPINVSCFLCYWLLNDLCSIKEEELKERLKTV